MISLREGIALNSVIEKRRGILINVAYFALIIAAFYLVFKTFIGILMPFIIALLCAALLQRPVRFISAKTPLKRTLASSICVLLLLGVIGSIVVFIVIELASKVKGFFNMVATKLQNISAFCADIKEWLLAVISFLPASVRTPISDNITLFFDDIIENGFENFSISSIGIDWASLLSKGGGVIKNTVVQLPSLVIAGVVSIISCVFMTADFDKIKAFMKRQLSDKNSKRIADASKLASGTLRKMFKAYSLIILITSCELSIGLFILQLLKIYDSPYIIIIALIIAIIDIIPVLGTGTVLIPWAVYSFITGNVSMGIGLIIMYAVILVIRQIIEPKLVAGQVGLPPIITIIAMYIGTKTLGVLGFFILPFGVILIKEFNDKGIIHLFKTGAEEDGAPSELQTSAENK